MKSNLSLKQLENYLNEYLDPNEIPDVAANGIQIENFGNITKIATAVTASLETIEKAVKLNAQVLIVHHGIFTKSDSHPIKITGNKYKKVKALIDANIALLCYHLPLDAHQEIGNNWKAARDLGLKNLKPFLEISNNYIGVIGNIDSINFDEFTKKVETYYKRTASKVKVKNIINSVAIVSGGADKFVANAAQAGADCFITGRVDEPVWDAAHEENISFLGLGHYATEVIGVKTLADNLSKKFDVATTFIETDNPF